MCVHGALAHLPPLIPKPPFVGRHRENRSQLDNAVRALRQLNLRPRFVKMQAATKLDGERDDAPTLRRDKGVHSVSHVPIMPECRNTVKRYSCITDE
jgi:hypothetical protein